MSKIFPLSWELINGPRDLSHNGSELANLGSQKSGSILALAAAGRMVEAERNVVELEIGMLKFGQFGTFVCISLGLMACTFVKPYRREVVVQEKNQREIAFDSAASQRHKDVVEALAALKYITEPISKEADSLPAETPENTLSLVDSEQKSDVTEKVRISAFSLAYEIFREISLGNLTTRGSSTGQLVQEFESLRAGRLTDGKAKTYIFIKGDINGHSGGNMPAGMDLILVGNDGIRKVFSIIEQRASADADSHVIRAGSFQLNLDQLYLFLSSFSQMMPNGQDVESLGGKISVEHREDGTYHLVSTDFGWGNALNIRLNNLDLTRDGSGNFINLDVKGSVTTSRVTWDLRVELSESKASGLDIKIDRSK